MNKVFIFVLGAAAGSLLTWKIVEEKYKRIADEEIQSVKDAYKNRDKTVKELTNEKTKVANVSDWTMNEVKIEDEREYANIVEGLSYSKQEEDDERYIVKVDVGEEVIEPFVIEPEDFGEMPGYDTESWSYHIDGIVTDEEGEIVTDYESVVGDIEKHFGEHDDDSVYVRNDNNKCDYEILRYYKPYNSGVEY